jgi:hypothetical protein
LDAALIGGTLAAVLMTLCLTPAYWCFTEMRLGL